mmetsp:Transcript_38655/g.91599  ORF Transcript_38655/g.91599 Transcript_38655/m.91599 type:complete len:233 (+) Transcript_38655:63-761(+)
MPITLDSGTMHALFLAFCTIFHDTAICRWQITRAHGLHFCDCPCCQSSHTCCSDGFPGRRGSLRTAASFGDSPCLPLACFHCRAPEEMQNAGFCTDSRVATLFPVCWIPKRCVQARREDFPGSIAAGQMEVGSYGSISAGQTDANCRGVETPQAAGIPVLCMAPPAPCTPARPKGPGWGQPGRSGRAASRLLSLLPERAPHQRAAWRQQGGASPRPRHRCHQHQSMQTSAPR